MKKLILTEVITTVVVIGIFVLVFTLINGWHGDPSVKYDAAIAAGVFAAAFAMSSAAIITAFFTNNNKAKNSFFAVCLILQWLMIFGIFKLITTVLV